MRRLTRSHTSHGYNKNMTNYACQQAEGVCSFLTHTLPDDHSASEVNKENTLGNIPKPTQHYPAHMFRERSGKN